MSMKSDDQLTEVGKVFQSLPDRFHSGRIKKLTTYYFLIDDEKWTVTLRPDSCEVQQGKAVEEADCYLETSQEVVLKAIRGDYTPSIMDFIAGKIKSKNPELLRAFRDAFKE